ncbi:MAG: alanine racemase [Bacteroidetes bacterium]|nr:MAG: alanine racemase [Bacteroidota bacterium]
MICHFSDIARLFPAAEIITASDHVVRHLVIDSRTSHTADSLFFAIKGERHDGHRFIADLYTKGLRSFVVQELPGDYVKKFPAANFIVVKNTIDALQEISAKHRGHFHYPVVGITGSNGKTIVKEWLYQLLREDYAIVRSPKSFNSQVGVPLSVWAMSGEHTLAIFEAGISRPGEMERLEKIIRPGIGIITNIGEAHGENFTSLQQKLDEKSKLFGDSCETIICCIDGATLPADKKRKLFTWSKKQAANLQITEIRPGKNETALDAVFEKQKISIRIPFTDEASVENAIHCWSLCLLLNVPQEKIAERMLQLSPVAMRLELKQGVNNCSVINDTYNSDLGSLAVALDFLNQQQQHPKRTLILSDILQSGRSEETLYKEVAELVSRKGIQRLIGIGEALTRRQQNFHVAQKDFFTDTRAFLAAYHSGFFANETILLKGARAFGFEQIGKLLQQKAHETVLEVNLNALVHNLNYFRSKLRPGTKLMAMVKAFSYGSGSFEIANMLQFHRIDYLAVAYADEGIELRKAGIRVPIMVMNPEEQGYEAMIGHRLEPEIFSFRVLDLFTAALGQYHPAGEEPFPVHIKIDTGMRRLGFEERDMENLAARLRGHTNLRVQSVFSHLAASDETAHDTFTREQFEKFTRMSDFLRKNTGYDFLRHVLNSAGISRFPEAQFDMVRLGIGLYGVGVNDAEQKQLQQVSTLKTTISQIKEVPEGESIGYSRKGRAARPTRIATVPIGYADGLSRRLSNGKGKMWIHGKAAPVIGNVCMDMCMLDITDIACAEGDDVFVFNEEHPITELAKDMDTIAYEVLTNVGARVKRVYYQE